MPRPKKPIDMQKAHLTLVEKQNRKAEEDSVTTGNSQLKTPPRWLINDVAKKEWRRIVRELNKIQIVGNLDYANLGPDLFDRERDKDGNHYCKKSAGRYTDKLCCGNEKICRTLRTDYRFKVKSCCC